MPEGKLVCCHNGNNVKWYNSDGHIKTYLPKKQRSFAQQLAIKKFLTLALSDLTHELRALDFYLDHHSQNTGKTEYLLTEVQGYQELLAPYFKTSSQKFSEWQTAPYQTNQQHPEHLVHKTAAGIMVRSKSESMIAYQLHLKKIPFRYECALQLGETTIYPDFTILHPQTGELFYWEHFGMMDESYYYSKTFPKLQLYTSYGIVPSINLITTYETKNCPLSSEMIEKIIEYYFE